MAGGTRLVITSASSPSKGRRLGPGGGVGSRGKAAAARRSGQKRNDPAAFPLDKRKRKLAEARAAGASKQRKGGRGFHPRRPRWVRPRTPSQ